MRWFLHRLLIPAVALVSAMNSHAFDLHPLGAPVPEAEVHFTLRAAARADEEVLVECTYRPWRERDVRKERHLHLFPSPWRSGSRDLVTVNRDESHVVRQTVRAAGGTVAFGISLRADDPAHRAYQLASVRVGRLEFARWFPEQPVLAAGFGLECTAESLRGTVRPQGLGAAPLSGALPLWPALRSVDLQVAAVEAPAVELCDLLAKHHWDGWRQTTPQEWPGGRSIVARHIAAPTVWRAHEYHAFPPGGTAPVDRPIPPSGVVSGVNLELFWPTGETLELPEVRFDDPVTVVAFPLSALSPRARDAVAERVRLRPGEEPGSLDTAAWAELEALGVAAEEQPAALTIEPAADGREKLVLRRRAFSTPWLFLFGAEYDEGRRVSVAALVLSPTAWPGPQPE